MFVKVRLDLYFQNDIKLYTIFLTTLDKMKLEVWHLTTVWQHVALPFQTCNNNASHWVIKVRRMQLNWPTLRSSYSMKNNCFNLCALMIWRRNRQSCTSTVPFGMHTFIQWTSLDWTSYSYSYHYFEQNHVHWTFSHRPLYYLKTAINLNKYPLHVKYCTAHVKLKNRTFYFHNIVSFH